MTHPLDRPIGSDLSQQVFEKRRSKSELVTPPLNLELRRRYALPSLGVRLDAYPADRPAIGDSFQGEVAEQHRLFRRG